MKEIIELPIHFNLPSPYLNVDDFIAFSTDIKKIVTEFNNVVFLGSLSAEVYVLPSPEAAFVGRWGIALNSTEETWGLDKFLDTETAKDFVQSLTKNLC